jgi:hypothetical protein
MKKIFYLVFPELGLIFNVFFVSKIFNNEDGLV